MNCTALAEKVSLLDPTLAPKDVSRLCLMLYNSIDDETQLTDEQFFHDSWSENNLRLQAATDQHAAMADELEQLSKSDPRKFTPDQIWVLIRAIKVQSQILRLYAGSKEYDLC